jgi:hypothetical protein
MATRIYSVTNLPILSLGSTDVYDMDNALVFLAPAPVAVYAEGEDRQVGSAILRQTERFVYADISIDYESESRLLAETGKDLWAHAMGRITVEPRRLAPVQVNLHAPIRVLGIDVEAVLLSLWPPSWRDGWARPFGRAI